MPLSWEPSLLRHWNTPSSLQILTSQRSGCRGYVARWAEIHDFTAVLPSPWTEVKYPIAFADDLRVVFHHHNGVPVGLEVMKDAHQPTAVARVQADARLVEDVERVDEGRAQRRCQVDSLNLATGQRARLAVERQVVQADGYQVAEAAANFAQQQGDGLVVGG